MISSICQRRMNLWVNYKKVLHDTFNLQFAHPWADWESKGTVLSAKVFKNDYIIKSRVVEIWNDKSSIYNNIIYPKTGSNLPCFGMDLMGFFDPGNHLSENVYIEKCTMSEVDEHLDMFTKYLTKYKEMVELEKPTGTDTSVYKDFDAYMTKLDPVSGYLSGKFGKQKAESLVNDFLFSYD